MKLTLRSRAAVAALAGFGAALPASAQTTTPPAWASVRAVGPGSQSVGATAIDAAGNTYETGTFTVSTTVGSVALTSQGSNDAYLAKYAPGGNLLWVRQLGSTGSELGLDVAVDAAGNAYVVGSFTGTIALGNGSTLQLEGGTTGNFSKGFVVRYSPQGTPEWARQSIINAASSVTMSGVAIDALGAVCVGGYMSRSITIGTATAATSGSVSGDFIVRFAPASGAVQQLTTGFEYAPVTSTASYYFPRLVAGLGGQLYLINQFSQSIMLNTSTFASRGLSDGFVVRFGPQNAPEWAQQFGGPGDDRPTNGAADAAGNLYVTGSFTGPATFGSSNTQPGFGSADGCLLKYSPQGALQWVQPMGGSSSDNLSDLALDAAGNIYVSGSFTGTAQCGPATLSSAGINDVVVAAYNPQGQLRWVQQAGGPGSDVGSYIGLDANENIYVLGRFATGCAFGPQVLTTAAPYESFAARLGSVGLASRAATVPLLACYPNPATARLCVPGLPVGAPVQLFDALGRLARQAALASDATLSVLGLAPGFYTLRATTSLGQPMTGKVTVE